MALLLLCWFVGWRAVPKWWGSSNLDQRTQSRIKQALFYVAMAIAILVLGYLVIENNGKGGSGPVF